ncbi:hypothetical protein FHN55_15350 [Streptomyces sp. NP160]|uniref:hypothetical protein n=1 Tax=Streptomyces sp. NP160 TaxID=2586637 RepID=UPI001167EA77|nr:hypothetical protein [Streptomyces sp. NP160]TNM63222.1 hypothetical protein FHN55_15350 [Streptomyces sp. NP160]
MRDVILCGRISGKRALVDIALVAVGGILIIFALLLSFKQYRRLGLLRQSVQHLTNRQRRELTRHFLSGSQVPTALSQDATELARLYLSQYVAVLLNLGLAIMLIGQVIGPLSDGGPWRLIAILAAASGLVGVILGGRQTLAGRRFLSRNDQVNAQRR